jgi:hypothetical protein
MPFETQHMLRFTLPTPVTVKMLLTLVALEPRLARIIQQCRYLQRMLQKTTTLKNWRLVLALNASLDTNGRAHA